MPKRYGKRYDFDPLLPVDKKVEEPVSEEQVAVVKEAVDEDPKTVSVKEPKKAVKKEVKSYKGKTLVLCNLRKSPEINGLNILNVVSAGTVLTIYDNPGEFYRVKLNNVEGYIKKDLCAKI